MREKYLVAGDAGGVTLVHDGGREHSRVLRERNSSQRLRRRSTNNKGQRTLRCAIHAHITHQIGGFLSKLGTSVRFEKFEEDLEFLDFWVSPLAIKKSPQLLARETWLNAD